MFSIGLTLSALATQVPMLMSTALMPHFAESAGRSGTDGKTYASAIRLLAALLFPLCFGTASLVPTLLPGVYGPAFRAAVQQPASEDGGAHGKHEQACFGHV